MNERIKELVGQAKFMVEETINRKISKNAELDAFAEKFAELIIKDCEKLNRLQSYELAGVIADFELGEGFDSTSLNTVKRVEKYLHSTSLAIKFADSCIDPNRDQTL